MRKRSPPTVKDDAIRLPEENSVKRKRKHKEHIDENGCEKAILHKRDSVVTAESKLSSMKSTLTEPKQLDDMRSGVEKMKSKLAEVTQSYKLTESEVKSESQKLRNLIDLKERKLLNELELVAIKETSQLKADIKIGEKSTQVYHQYLELMDQAGKSDSEMDIYEMYRSCESGVAESVHDADTDWKNMRTVENIRLKKNTDQLIKTMDEFPLGAIEIISEDGIDLTATLELRNTINVEVACDKHRPAPYDVIVLEVNGIHTVVVTDQNNCSVKSFFCRNNQPCHSKLRLKGPPCCLSKLMKNQVVITVPCTNSRILTVEVNPDLKLLSP